MNKMIYKTLLFALISYTGIHANLTQQWRDFLMASEAVAQDRNHQLDATQFKLMLSDLQSLDALPLWKATVFFQDMRKKNISGLLSPEKKVLTRTLLKKFTADYTAQTQNIFKKCLTYKKIISQLHAQCDKTFTKIASVQELEYNLQENIIDPMTSSEFVNDFKTAPFIAKIILCDVMKSTIDIVDKTIKTVKSSHNLNMNARIAHIKSMLGLFNRLFKTWACEIMPELALKYHSSWPLGSYIQVKQQLFDTIMATQNDQSALAKSPHFSVNAAMLGSSTAFERHYPSTIEDMFMLIHQNSLVVVAGTYNSLFPNAVDTLIDIPQQLQECASFFEKQFSPSHASRPQRIGINYTADSIEFLYNMALRNHSSTFQIAYNQTTQQCSLSIQFVGEARQRWEQIAFLANLSPELSGLKHAHPVVFDKNAGIVSCSWIIKNKTDLDCISKYVSYMAVLSYESSLYMEMLTDVNRNALSITQLNDLIKRTYLSAPGDYPTVSYCFDVLSSYRRQFGW